MKMTNPLSLELFAGSGIFSETATENGFDTITVDSENWNGKIDIVENINIWNYKKLKIKPIIIWASVPCTAFSKLSWYRYFLKNGEKYYPNSYFAEHNIKLVKTTLKIIEYFNPKFWFIENPFGILQYLNIIPYHYEYITQCQYTPKVSMQRNMKPTIIYTNSKWKGLKCNYNDLCHAYVPSGSNLGTISKKGHYERSILPYLLCKDIIDYCKINMETDE